jgi:hypothetical protein
VINLSQQHRKLGHKVKPLRKVAVQRVAQTFRDSVGIKSEKINICALYELLQDMGFLEFEIVDDWELLGMEAQTKPDDDSIQIRQSVYDLAAKGDGHCRFTLAHELGHLLLHKDQEPVSYARGEIPKHEIYEDSEWQADVFASELLMDSRLVDPNKSASEVASKFGTSATAAAMKIRDMKKK